MNEFSRKINYNLKEINNIFSNRSDCNRKCKNCEFQYHQNMYYDVCILEEIMKWYLDGGYENE